jgi:hypothetical protein
MLFLLFGMLLFVFHLNNYSQFAGILEFLLMFVKHLTVPLPKRIFPETIHCRR